jgi:hypothetical protein
MTDSEKHVEKKTSSSIPKTTYNRPQLVVYGSVREITLTKQKANTSDNPGNDNNMTAFG